MLHPSEGSADAAPPAVAVRPAVGDSLVRDLALALLIALAAAGGVFAEGAARYALLALAAGVGIFAPFAGLLAITLAVWTLPLMQMPAVVADIRADEILLGAVALGAVIRMVARRDWKPGTLERAFVVFIALMVVSAGLKYAFAPGYDVAIRAVAMPVVRQALRLVLFVSAAYLLAGRTKRVTAVALVATAGALGSAALGIVQYHSVAVHGWVVANFPTLDGAATYPYVPGGPGYRSMGTFDGNPNHFGISLVVMALFSVVMARRSRDTAPRVAWGSGALVMLVAVLFTTSRTAFLVAVVMLIVAAVLLRSRVPAIVLAAWLTMMALIPNKMPQRVLDLLGTPTATGVVADPSVTGRLSAVTESAGSGSQALPLYDNFYVDLFRNFGPLALAGFLVLAWVVGSRLLKMARDTSDGRGYAAAALLVWCTLLIVSFTGGFFATQRLTEVVWTLVALAFAWGDADPSVIQSGGRPRLSQARARIARSR